MEKVKLQVQQRQDLSRHGLNETRRLGMVPASLYGKGKSTVHLIVNLHELVNAIKYSDAGMHSILELKLVGDGDLEGDTAVIKSIQRDPLTRKLLQIDFERVLLTDMIVTPVPVETYGHAVGVDQGGILEQVAGEIEVKTRADHIPVHIDVDVSRLDVGDVIHASDVELPEGVELASRPDYTIVTIVPPHIRRTAGAVAEETEEE